MSLSIKSISYNTVRVSTFHDIEVFAEELKTLIVHGYNMTLDVAASNSDFQNPWISSKFPPVPKSTFNQQENISTEVKLGTV